MSPAKIVSLLLFVVLVVSPFAFAIDQAESDVSEIFAIQTINGVHSSLPNPSYFGRCLAGNFNAGVTPDFVYLSETTPVLVLNPDLYETSWAFPLDGATVSDIARLPRQNELGSDGILTAGSAGLQLWTLSSGDLTTLTLEGDPRWDGASSLGLHDLDADQAPDLFGIDANGDIVIKFAVGLGSPSLTIPAPAGETFDEVVALNDHWNPGFGKLVTIGSDGMRMYDHLGVLTVHWPVANPRAIAIVTEDGVPDRIAIVSSPTGIDQRLVVLNHMGGYDTVADLDTPVISVMTSARVVHSMSSGPDDLDPTDDLVLVTAQNEKLFLLENEGSGLFNVSEIMEIECGGGSGPVNATFPCFADMDGDGDMDGLYADQGNGALTLLRGTGQVSFDYSPSVSLMAWLISTSDTPGAASPTDDGSEVFFASEFTAAPEIQGMLARVGPGLELRLQIRYYRGPHRERLGDRDLEDWGLGADDYLQRGEELLVNPTSGEVDVAAFFQTGEFASNYPVAYDHIYFFFMRYVVVDSSSGRVKDHYPARAIGMTTESGSGALYHYLTTLPGVVESYAVGIEGTERPAGLSADWFVSAPSPVVQDNPGTESGTTSSHGIQAGSGAGLGDPIPDLPEDIDPGN